MTGVLDKKSRMLDTLLTREGRRQLATGALRISFVSFTDAETFYQGDSVSGSADASERLFLEACDLPHDQITFEADDSGKLKPFRSSPLDALEGKILSGSSDGMFVVTGSEFVSLAGQLLSSSVDSFNKLYAIRTDDAFFDEEREFKANTDQIVFTINDTIPFGRREIKAANIDKIESLFQDKRLSNLPNFQYLPPVNRSVTRGSDTTPLGNYPIIGQNKTPLTFDQIEADIARREQFIIDFNQTTLQSNVFCQLFEINHDQVLKLDIIDFGDVNSTNPDAPDKRVFFAGKVFVDSFGCQTFVNIFTIIFE